MNICHYLKSKMNYPQFILCMEIVAPYFWLILLKNTDSYFSVYILCAVLSVYGHNQKVMMENNRVGRVIVSAVLSVMVISANYRIFVNGSGVLKAVICFFMGIFVFDGWVMLVENVSEKVGGYTASKTNHIFIVSLCVLLISYGFYFIMAAWPGNLDTDSFRSIKQILSGNYSDHHPICFTLLVKFWLDIGRIFSSDINLGIGLYILFQMSAMILIYAFIIDTVNNIAGKKIALAFWGWYAVNPIHICNNVSVWKDIIFSGAVALFVCALTRILYGLGRERINYICLLLGGIGFTVFRHNGKIAFIGVLIFMLCLRKMIEKKIVAVSMSAFGLAFVLISTGMKATGAEKTATVDSLSIPLQQISRVLADGCEITNEQRQILGQVADLEKIPDLYVYYVSDPIKGEVYTFGNQQYIKRNIFDFVKAYVQIGLRYPDKYVKAWIDMTRGYWNGGYPYFKWANYVKDNDLGIRRSNAFPLISKCYDVSLRFIAKSSLLQPCISIGFHIWIWIISIWVFVCKENGKALITVVPVALIVVTIYIATPLDSELRYVYPIFTCLPLTIGQLFVKRSTREIQK